MKRLIPILLLLSAAPWIGCGDDDGPTDPPPVTAVRVLANSSAGTPSITDANDPIWSGVDAFIVDLKKGGTHPKRIAKASVVAASAAVQAVVDNGYLYLRLVWDDTSFNVWRQHYYIYDSSTLAHHDRKDILVQAEDQLLLLFEDGTGVNVPRDAWNWRVLTTGGGGFAEGFTYEWTDTTIIFIGSLDTVFHDSNLIVNGADSIWVDTVVIDTVKDTTNTTLPHIVTDGAGSKLFEVALENQEIFGEPIYYHWDTSEFNADLSVTSDYILKLSEKRHRLNDPVDSTFIDSVLVNSVWIYNWGYRYASATTGWKFGQRVPGWMIEDGAVSYSEAELGSRWDIRSAMAYDAANGVYSVVLRRKLNTTYGDDLNMALLDSVKTRLLILNNRASVFTQDTWRGVSDAFWIIL